MQCYTELTPPTAVTHSLSLPFLSSDAQNLIVAKSSLLQIFSLKTLSEEIDVTARDTRRDRSLGGRRGDNEDGFESSFLVADSALVRAERTISLKLALVAECPVSGTITSMVAINTLKSKSGGQSILLGFRDAKLSLVEWDTDRNGLSTTSIHYFEQDDLVGSPWAPELGDCVNYVSVDPMSRCAALKFSVRSLAILPFKQSDDDTTMDDWDEELDGPRPAPVVVPTNEDSKIDEVPYGSSFVLRFSSLHPALIYPIHLAFLYEYREPTFGILSSTMCPSASLLRERRDHLTYMVFTLDLQQKASTTILAVTGLPYDLYKVIALPPPVGGVLLVGGNELVHIDQSGKTNGVAVNSFAKQCTSFGLADQADLDMRLEGCNIEQISIDNGEMLVILNTGELCILSFRMDGRSVSGLEVRRVAREMGGFLLSAQSSCVSSLAHNAIFVGNESSDSCILAWNRKSKQADKGRMQNNNAAASNMEDDLELEDDEDDEDDLYGDAPTEKFVSGEKAARGDSTNSKAGDLTFRVHDRLLNIAPLRDITFGKPYQDEDNNGVKGELQLVATSGAQDSGSLVILTRELEPTVIGSFEFPEARGVWTVNARQNIPKAVREEKGATALNTSTDTDAKFDKLMIVSKVTDTLTEESAVYALTAAGFEDLTGTEFEPAAGATVEAGTLGDGLRIIQVLKSEIRSYDGDLGLAQILPMFDEETGAEPKIVSASIAEPFLLCLRDDSSIFLAQCDSSNDLEEVERDDSALLTTKWLSGCLYTDRHGVFATSAMDPSQQAGNNVVMFLLSTDGALLVYALPDLASPIYRAEGLHFLPTTIAPQYTARRSPARETLTELLVADLGDETTTSPYLILRSASDDLTIYDPFRTNKNSLSSALHFSKVHNPHLAISPQVISQESTKSEESQGAQPLVAVRNIGGYCAVFLPGSSPSFLLKTSKCSPKVVGLRGTGVRGLSSFHTAGCDHGFICLDTSGVARVSQFPADTTYELGLPVRKVEMGEDIGTVAYHPPSATYAVAANALEAFELPKDDDYHREWQKEEIAFKPLLERSSIKLLSPTTWSVIDTIELDPGEVVMCTKVLNLEVSEETHERKQLITVGTATLKGEDLATKGCVYVYDVVSVVPEPGRPETNQKLKLIAKEIIPRGAVTSVSEIGSQGFMIIAQGQKCMVRGLKEDGTLLPVAFMDVNTYVTSVKELPGTGLCVLADALKGVWLAGYTEEPYKMIMFGKQTEDMEILTAEALPIGDQLFIVAADSDCNLHVLQYDPEHPKSLHGFRLLHRTSFSLGGHAPSTMNLLPSTKATTAIPDSEDAMDIAADETIPSHQILMTTTSGVIALLSPLSETQYRRMSTLTNHLCNTLYHACGLNPKAYRIDDRAPEAIIGGRPIVDGTILMRWMELGTQRRAEVASRVGVDTEQVREDLEMLMGGIMYL